MSHAAVSRRGANSEINKLAPQDRAIHEWYRFVLSFPPHLVRAYLESFAVGEESRVLDPFCGTGTVLVECKKQGIQSIGIEAHPMAHLASQVKIDWRPDPDGLIDHACRIADRALARLQSDGIEDAPLFALPQNGRHPLQTLPPERLELLLTDSISPLPLHKTLTLLDCLKEQYHEQYHNHERLALAKALVSSISNLHFGPEVGVGPAKLDAPVIAPWLSAIRVMANDLREAQRLKEVSAEVHHADARQIRQILEPHSIDAVITSPPYPNEKDYTRTTRLESVLLGFVSSKAQLQELKRSLVRSNTRGVYKGDDDDQWVADHAQIQHIAQVIEARRIELGKTSGFERLYATVTKLYFGGMKRHLASLRAVLRPGAKLAYVVGDQASYLRVLIPTGQLLAEIAESLGYELVKLDLFRTRVATATKEELREEVLVLHWPGEPLFSARLAHRALPDNHHAQDEEQRHMDGLWDDAEAQLLPPQQLSRYQQIMERIFFWHYKEGDREVEFERDEMVRAAQELESKLPKNLGDIPYTFHYRRMLPKSILDKAPDGEDWIIQPAGRSRYRFVASKAAALMPNLLLAEIKIPDATPGVVAKYALGDEQALLAKLQYNRLIDIFTGVTCYSLQNHLRTTVPGIGQVETDEIYIGVDRRGAHYVFPVQAKGGKDKLGIVQIEQDFALCRVKFPGLICRPIAAQFVEHDLIALFEFEQGEKGSAISVEKHYRLVPPDQITLAELEAYRSHTSE